MQLETIGRWTISKDVNPNERMFSCKCTGNKNLSGSQVYVRSPWTGPPLERGRNTAKKRSWYSTRNGIHLHLPRTLIPANYFMFLSSLYGIFCSLSSYYLPPSLTVSPLSDTPSHPAKKHIRSVSEVEWWHNFHIRQQSPSLFQSYFPHESFNVGLLEMALLTELQGGNIDYASWFHQVSGRNGMLKGVITRRRLMNLREGCVCISRFHVCNCSFEMEVCQKT